MCEQFSVVIPLYNKAQYILRTLNSILCQTYQNFEIIVVDDGSTDGGGNLIKDIKDSRIRLIHQENAGVSAARNRGIKESSYNLIAFLDADDEWGNNYLDTIVSLNKLYPDCGAYATNYYVQSDKKSLYHNANSSSIPEGIIENYFYLLNDYPPFYSSSIVLSTKVFSSVGYFENKLKMGEDLHMWIRVANDYPIAYSPKPLCIYHKEASNRACLSNNRLKNNLEFVDTLGTMIDKIDIKKRPDFLELIYHIRLVLAGEYLVAGNKTQAKLLLQCSKKTSRFRKQHLKWSILSLLPIQCIHPLWAIKSIIKK
jgi:glycosyltransferase involved in cell wall biosynthesis